MIYLLLAIASSAMVSICMRLSGKHVKNEMGMFMANYAICVCLSYFFLDTKIQFDVGSSVMTMIILGIISGILYLVSFVIMKVNMKHNGIVLTSTFMKLGVLIPTLMAVTVFREMPRWTQVLGIALSIFAIVMINFEKESVQEGNRKSLLLVLLVLSGFADAMANIFEELGEASLKDGYLLTTFGAAFVLAFIFAIFGKERIGMKDILFGMLIGIPNYFSARFLLLALGSVKAVLVYPMYSVTTIIAVTLVGVTFFREKISRKKVMALGIIAVALCLLNI